MKATREASPQALEDGDSAAAEAVVRGRRDHRRGQDRVPPRARGRAGVDSHPEPAERARGPAAHRGHVPRRPRAAARPRRQAWQVREGGRALVPRRARGGRALLRRVLRPGLLQRRPVAPHPEGRDRGEADSSHPRRRARPHRRLAPGGRASRGVRGPPAVRESQRRRRARARRRRRHPGAGHRDVDRQAAAGQGAGWRPARPSRSAPTTTRARAASRA